MVSRRKVLKSGFCFGVANFLPNEAYSASTDKPKHSVVHITLQGGWDHALFVPVFKGDTLSDAVEWVNPEIFEVNSYPYVKNPFVFHEESGLIQKYGDKMTVLHGIEMEGQNGHTGALKIVNRGSTSSRLSFSGVLAEMLGGSTNFGLISLGKPPYQNTTGLSEKGSGIVLPRKVRDLSNYLSSEFNFGGIDLGVLDDLSSEFYNSKRFSEIGRLNIDTLTFNPLQVFRNFSGRANSKVKSETARLFLLDESYIAPYLKVENILGLERHEPFAMAAQLIGQDNLAASYSLNIGFSEGQKGYDTHNFIHNNDWKQQRLLQMDLQALEIFLDQIKDKMEHTTIIVTSEFGRTPKKDDNGGKGHWGPNNAMMIFSPLFRKQLFGRVNPDTYIADKILYEDGSSQYLTFRSIYRGILEGILSRGLQNCSDEIVNKIYRQYLLGQLPKGVFA